MLNSQQVEALFNKESILIGQVNAVPLYRVRELFGDRAVGFAHNVAKDGFRLFGIGDFQLPYATFTGFQIAATYKNINEIRDTVGQIAGYDGIQIAKDSLIPGYILELLKDIRVIYPSHFSAWDIIEDALEKVIRSEKRRKNHKKND